MEENDVDVGGGGNEPRLMDVVALLLKAVGGKR